MKLLSLSLLLMFAGITSWAQQNTKPIFTIPENEYLVSKMVNELENERKQLSQDLKYLERLAGIVKENSTALNTYMHIKIDSREALDNAYSKIKLKYIDRTEFANVSDFDIKDMANEFRSITFDDFYWEDVADDSKINYKEIDENFKMSIESMKVAYSSLQGRVESIKQSINKKIEEIDGKLSELYSQKSQNTDLHRISILIGLPAFCITILLLFLVPYYLERKSASNDSTANNKQYLLDVATVLLLTLTILILGLAKMITGEVLGTLLGGISGYVLNRTMRNPTN